MTKQRERHGWFDDPLLEQELKEKEPLGPNPQLPEVEHKERAVLYDADGRPMRRLVGFPRGGGGR